jgi:endonuclease IV
MSIGFHISKTKSVTGVKRHGSMCDAIKEDIALLAEYGLSKEKSAQIFVTGPKSFSHILTEEDKICIRNYLKSSGVRLVIHGSYADNPWNNRPGTVHNIREELKIAAEIGAAGVIVHLGNFDGIGILERIAVGLPASTLWLEINAAKSSRNTYETPEKIKTLFNIIKGLDTGNLKIGLCIDTAHLYSCGVDIGPATVAQQWLEGLPDIPAMIHLNDSHAPLGAGLDRHAALGHGNIWRNYNGLLFKESGLAVLLKWARDKDCIVILERECGLIHTDLTFLSANKN